MRIVGTSRANARRLLGLWGAGLRLTARSVLNSSSKEAVAPLRNSILAVNQAVEIGLSSYGCELVNGNG
ncbi:MAG: hypothetical protein LBF87_02435 [Treponema sp.]|nr:hypothetical protein [Treponema sp.]